MKPSIFFPYPELFITVLLEGPLALIEMEILFGLLWLHLMMTCPQFCICYRFDKSFLI